MLPKLVDKKILNILADAEKLCAALGEVWVMFEEAKGDDPYLSPEASDMNYAQGKIREGMAAVEIHLSPMAYERYEKEKEARENAR